MLNERKRLESELHSLQNQLSTFPEGKLICSRNGKSYKWYHSDGKNLTYIKKNCRSYAQQLAFKKYFSVLSRGLETEIRALNFYLNHHHDIYNEAEKLLTEENGFRELLTPHFQTFSKNQSDWVHADYERNTRFPQNLKHRTSSGNLVRSKSESMIDYVLTTHGIPFRYECALTLGDTTIYPDFTILHPRTNQIVYWDHFGRMDDPSYNKNVGSKLQLYINHNIIPSINLITTYETKDWPLTIPALERIVEDFFLD